MFKSTLAIIFFAGALIAAGSFDAEAQSIPPGSYQMSCKNVGVDGNVLSAACNRKSSGMLEDAGIVGKKFAGTDALTDFFLCADDIRNDDGLLKCTKSVSAPLMLKAKAALESQFPRFHGRPFKGDGEVFVRELFKSDKNATALFYKGLTTPVADQILNRVFVLPDETQARLAVIDRAFNDVYGFGPQPKDVAFWSAEFKKPGYRYEIAVAAETKKLNTPGSDGKNPTRRLMIAAAYKKSMGRNPKSEDFATWEKRPENFKQLVEACRSWLYSSKGATDLIETIERKLTQKSGGKKPDKDQIKQAVEAYGVKRLIFSEM